jgi:hypothetical protein
MIEVTLKWYEIKQAAEVGVMRRVASLKNNPETTDSVTLCPTSWETDCEGAIGELVVAKALNLYWAGSVNTGKAFDVADLQVRTTPRHSNRLIIRPKDIDDHKIIHVTGQPPVYRVHGWLLVRDGKKESWLEAPNNRPPAYFIPNNFLRPIKELNVQL